MITARIIDTGRQDYPYNVHILVDGIYAGVGRFCRSSDEVVDTLNMYDVAQIEKEA